MKKSVTPDYMVCLEDGKKFKSLKRHLRTAVRHDARAVPREVGPAGRLPDGGAELRQGALRARQGDGPRPAAPKGCGQGGCSLGQGLFAGEARQKAGAVGLPKTPRAAAATSYVEGCAGHRT